jgi:hypothetical protein
LPNWQSDFKVTLPNFLIIGAPKAGTTTIFNVLLQHPDIYLCKIKEVGFFWAKGQPLNLQGPGTDLLKHRLVNTLPDYQALFSEVKDEKAIGEASVRYLSEYRAPEQIHTIIPQTKLIVSLRQPADRAFSSFTRNLRDGLEPCLSFADALEEERKGLRQNWIFGRYLDKGFYYSALQRYLDFFDRDQMHISLLEDLIESPGDLVRDIFNFLGVDDTVCVDFSHRYNASGIIRNPVLRYIWTRSGSLKSRIRSIIPGNIRRAASEWMIKDVVKPNFPTDIRQELTATYRQDILNLQDLLGRDLSHWLVPEPKGTIGLDIHSKEK